MLSRLFIAALWSPAGKGLTSWLLMVMFIVIFVTFPCGILGQVWYLVVSFPNLCRLSYVLYKNYLICIFMNINENLKMRENQLGKLVSKGVFRPTLKTWDNLNAKKCPKINAVWLYEISWLPWQLILRHKRMRCTYKNTHILAATRHGISNLVPSLSLDIAFYIW